MNTYPSHLPNEEPPHELLLCAVERLEVRRRLHLRVLPILTQRVFRLAHTSSIRLSPQQQHLVRAELPPQPMRALVEAHIARTHALLVASSALAGAKRERNLSRRGRSLQG